MTSIDFKLEKHKTHLVYTFPGITAGTSLKASGDFKLGKSKDEREVFLNSVGVEFYSLVALEQTHSNRVHCYQEGGLITDADAVITDKSGVVLTIQTADCCPVFVYDKSNTAVGLIHAGWKGIQTGIVQNTIEALNREYGLTSENLQCFIGPTIGSCCYEFAKDYVPEFKPFIEERDQRGFLNIPELVKGQLIQLGIKESNILNSKICTSCSGDDFFSYRRDGKQTGRMISYITKNSF